MAPGGAAVSARKRSGRGWAKRSVVVTALVLGASREPVAEAARGPVGAQGRGSVGPVAGSTAAVATTAPTAPVAGAGAAVAGSAALVATTAPGAPKPIAPPLPLSIAVALADGKTAQTQAWIDAQIAEAQRLYNAFGVSFRKAAVRRLPARFAALETRKDRDALATQLEPGVINVFIVASLRDVDDPKLYRMGVHWAPNGDLKRQYVIVASEARKTTMAHEIGHFFTLQHTSSADNLMSYVRTGAEVFMSAGQRQAVILSVKSHVARKQLLP